MLYNVSFDKIYDTTWYPRVPDCVGPGEDKVTPRICLSDTVEHCISAMGFSNRNVYVGAEIVVRSVDIADLTKDKILYPVQLYERSLVKDALYNHEHWYLGKIDFKLSKYRILKIDWEYELNFTCISKKDVANRVQMFTDKLNADIYSSSYDMYLAAIRLLESEGRYDDSDDLYDDLTEIPYSQAIKFNKLEAEVIE